MDPEGSTGGMGTHKNLEQGHRARSKGDEEGCRPRTLQDAGRRHTGVPEHQDVAEGVHPHQLPQATGEPGHRGHPCDDAATRTGMGQRREGEGRCPAGVHRGQRQLRPGISGAEGPGTGTGLRNPPGVDATQPEPSNQAEGRREQARPQTPPAYPVGTGARTAGGNQPQPLLRARSVGHGTEVPADDLPEGRGTCSSGVEVDQQEGEPSGHSWNHSWSEANEEDRRRPKTSLITSH